jgi:hypothetical protein
MLNRLGRGEALTNGDKRLPFIAHQVSRGVDPDRDDELYKIRTVAERANARILLPFFSTRPMSTTKLLNISIIRFLGTP